MIPLALDTSGMHEALKEYVAFKGYGTRKITRIINKKMGRTLYGALERTPKASYTGMARELNLRLKIKRSHTITRGGKTWKTKGGAKFAGAASNVELPMIVAILQARARRGGYSAYFGVSHRRGVARMKKEIKRVTGVRARSIGFLRSIFASAMKPFTRDMGWTPRLDKSDVRPVGKQKGFGTRATDMLQTAEARLTQWTKRQGDKGWRRYMYPALVESYALELKDFRQHVNDALYEAAKQQGIPARR